SFGPSGRWTRAYVQQILGDRRPVGEYQPRGRGGKADGDPIAGYLPAAVTEAEWQAARHGSLSRRNRRGRNGGRVTLFSAMVKDAHSGQPYHIGLQTSGGHSVGRHILRTRASVEGRSGSRTFPLEVFERAVLSMLAEIDPRELLDRPEEPDKVMA